MMVHAKDQISEAGDAPFNSMTSGATEKEIAWSNKCDNGRKPKRTPIGCSRNIVLDVFHGTKVQRHTKVRELHIPRLGRQDICSLEIAMYNLKEQQDKLGSRKRK